ncbi:MAG: metal-binding protein, partial [Comamonadaceae bacterium]|nr:metal-binding protein [Comamonadaceae bacterium]
MQRRTLLRSATALSGLAATTLLALSAPLALAQARRPLPVMEVWKDPHCGCCDDWITYLEKNGFSVRAFDTGNIAVRQRLGMPEKYGSCHTAL